MSSMQLLPFTDPALYLLMSLLILASAFLQGVGGVGFTMFSAPIAAIVCPELVPGPLLMLGGCVTFLTAVRERRDIAWSFAGSALTGRALGSIVAVVALSQLTQGPLNFLFAAAIFCGRYERSRCAYCGNAGQCHHRRFVVRHHGHAYLRGCAASCHRAAAPVASHHPRNNRRSALLWLDVFPGRTRGSRLFRGARAVAWRKHGALHVARLLGLRTASSEDKRRCATPWPADVLRAQCHGADF